MFLHKISPKYCCIILHLIFHLLWIFCCTGIKTECMSWDKLCWLVGRLRGKTYGYRAHNSCSWCLQLVNFINKEYDELSADYGHQLLGWLWSSINERIMIVNPQTIIVNLRTVIFNPQSIIFYPWTMIGSLCSMIVKPRSMIVIPSKTKEITNLYLVVSLKQIMSEF